MDVKRCHKGFDASLQSPLEIVVSHMMLLCCQERDLTFTFPMSERTDSKVIHICWELRRLQKHTSR